MPMDHIMWNELKAFFVHQWWIASHFQTQFRTWSRLGCVPRTASWHVTSTSSAPQLQGCTNDKDTAGNQLSLLSNWCKSWNGIWEDLLVPTTVRTGLQPDLKINHPSRVGRDVNSTRGTSSKGGWSHKWIMLQRFVASDIRIVLEFRFNSDSKYLY